MSIFSGFLMKILVINQLHTHEQLTLGQFW